MTKHAANRARVSTPRVMGLLTAALGVFVLVGWVTEHSGIKSVIEGAVDMKANTAVGLLLSGMALCLLDSRGQGLRVRVGQAMGLAVALLGLVTLGQFAFGWSLGIDELLFRDTSGFFTPHPGRMSPYSAVAFATIGLGLAALPVRALRWLALVAGSLALLIGAFSFIGYLWGASEVVTDQFASPVAVHTAFGFILIGAGTLIACLAMDGRAIGKFRDLSSVEKRSLAGFVATLVILLIAGGVTYRATVTDAESAAMVVHTQQVRVTLGRMYGAASDAESQQRSYLLGGNASQNEDFRTHAAQAMTEAGTLTQLVADNPDQSKRMADLRTALQERMERLERLADIFETSGLAAAQEVVREGEGIKLMAEIRAMVSEMDSTEAALLTAREAEAARDGEQTLVSLLVTLAVAVGGFLILFLGIRREMNSRARAEDALRRSEESLSVTLHSIGDAVLATDTEGRVTRMNPVAENLTGWNQADAHGLPIAEVFRIINEETRKPAIIPVDKVLASGEVQGLANHTVLIAREGTERPIADSAAPIRDRQGNILGVVLVCRDVSAERAAEKALRDSEARYRTLFEEIDEGFCIIEMIFGPEEKPVDYRFLEINPSFERQTGLSDAVGKRMRELAPEHEEHWFEIYGHIALTGESRRFQNRAEQLHRTYDVYAFRFGDPTKRHVAILFNDITERRRTEEHVAHLNADLQKQAAQLEAANKELEAFSYSVSHDLRAPLRHVQGYVEMLARDSQDVLPEKSRRYLCTISEAARDMGQLIDDLLSFSRMGRAELHEETFELNELVDEVRGELAIAAGGRDIHWTVATLPPVRGDQAMLKQVLVNLLGNAVKYTRGRTPAVIEIGCAPGADGWLEFFVRDNGAGFDMKYADKLFGVFQRLHRADEFEGTGIGLANVRRIIARHEGRTWAEGKPDAGATVYFTLKAVAIDRPAHTR
ncbi:MAG TPA: CHASE3 domain-containing protein [Opitutaceae bacterium]|nr:CHASE3 domain-containing protein [Opitutaceae bacterium]